MISIIIPAFNEEKSIINSNFIETLINVINEKNYENYEILVINDGSTDKTEELLNKLKNKFNVLKILSNALNQGYGSSLKLGIKNSKYDIIVICDIDGTYPADQVPIIIDKFIDSKKSKSKPIDMIVTQRTGKHYWESFIKTSLRFILKFIVEWTSGFKIIDINSGLRIFSKKTIEPYLPRLSNFFSFTSTLTLSYLLTNKSVDYHPIKYLYREGEQNTSRVKIFRDSLRTLQYVFEVTVALNPLKFFLLLSIIFLIFSVLLLLFFISFKINLLSNISLIFLTSSIVSIIVGFASVLFKKNI